MSRRVIGLGFTNQAKCEKWNNNAIGGIGARSKSIRNAIISRSGCCCNCNNNNNNDCDIIADCNENFITLEQAKLQGGVNDNEILFLCSNRNLILTNDFTIQNGGYVIFGDIKNPQGNLPNGNGGIDTDKFAGIFIPLNKTLTVHGEIILGDISSDANNNKNVYGIYNKGTIEISNTGSITMGDISSVNQNAHGIFQESTIQKHTDSDSAGAIQMGNITSTNANAFGVKNGDLNDVRVQIGNVSGSGEVAAVNLFDNTTTGNMSAHVIAGDVTNSGNSSTNGIIVYNLSGSFTCGDVSSTGQSLTTNVITVTGLLFTTVYPEAQVTIGNISATNGICRGAFSDSETAILAGTTNIGSISSTINFDYTDTALPILPIGGIVRNLSLLDQVLSDSDQVLSDSFVTYNGIGKGLEFEISINSGFYTLNKENIDNTTDYQDGETITINGAYFGGNNANNVILTINSVDANGAITKILLTSDGIPANPRVTSTGMITTNGLSGSFIVKDCDFECPIMERVRFYNYGINVNNLSGSATCGAVLQTGGYCLEVIGIKVTNTLSGKANCGLIFQSEGSPSSDVLGIYVITLSGSAVCESVNFVGKGGGIKITTLSGNASCGDVVKKYSGVGWMIGINITTITENGIATCRDLIHTPNPTENTLSVGIQVENLQGKASCGNITVADGIYHSDTIGIKITNTLHSTGSAICGNISTPSTIRVQTPFPTITPNVFGIEVANELAGKAICGNVICTGNATVTGIQSFAMATTGNATCGDVSKTGTGAGNVTGLFIANSTTANQGRSICGNVTSSGSGIVIGISSSILSDGGTAICGDVSKIGTGAGNVTGITVGFINIGTSTTCGNVTSSGSGDVKGFRAFTLDGSATCGNVEGKSNVFGIEVTTTLSGSATCGNVKGNGTDAGNVFGVSMANTATLSGTVICGTVSTDGTGTATGISNGTINGNVIIKSASTGVYNLVGTEETPGTGNVIIGSTGDTGDPGTNLLHKLNLYIYNGAAQVTTAVHETLATNHPTAHADATNAGCQIM